MRGERRIKNKKGHSNTGVSTLEDGERKERRERKRGRNFKRGKGSHGIRKRFCRR
jgi:hypothetical protein